MPIDAARAEEIRRIVDAGTGNRTYWHSCTPHERLFAMELMRQKEWGYDKNSCPRLDRTFFEIVDVSKYRNKGEHVQTSDKPPTERQ
jgi:hypothetical protein